LHDASAAAETACSAASSSAPRPAPSPSSAATLIEVNASLRACQRHNRAERSDSDKNEKQGIRDRS
jgi:hypothetical protein